MEPILEVLEPGLLTTVQDAGRWGYGDLGVPIGGACDPWSFGVANALLGNDAGAAALEITLLGPTLRALREVVIAIAGADLGARVEPAGRRVAPGSTVRLSFGEVLAYSDGAGDGGARAYVGVAGGIDVPVVLGSRSTCLVASFGGFDGRALRPGDRISAQRPGREPDPARSTWPAGLGPRLDAGVRILPGPDAGAELLTALTSAPWSVSPASDRRGVRLTGTPLLVRTDAGSHLTTGVMPGTIQLPPDGQPIVLLADAQPTGGYPVIGVVIEADLPLVGQLAAAEEIRFSLVDQAAARTANATRRRDFEAARRELSAGSWHLSPS